jgi:hypothetical protein
VRKLLAIFAILIGPLPAAAQSIPAPTNGFGIGQSPAQGAIWSISQWDHAWASKQDYNAAGAFTGLGVSGTTHLYAADWLTSGSAYQLAWPVTGANAAVLSPNGQIALTTASRASQLSNSYGSLETTIGTAGFAFNDDVFAASGRHLSVYAGYDEAQTLSGSSGLAFGREIDAVNFGPQATATSPGSPEVYGSTIALWLASGGSHAGVTDATEAIGIKDNGARFQTGIIVGANALTNYSGFGYAMRLAKGHIIQWHDASDVAGPNITSTVATAANSISMQFQDGGVSFVNQAGGLDASIQAIANAVNGVALVPSVTGAPTQVAAIGADTNVELNLTAKGTAAIYAASPFVAGSTFEAGGNAAFLGTVTVSAGLTSVQALAMTSTAETNSGTYTGGTRYGGDILTDWIGNGSAGATLFVNSLQGSYSPNSTTYPNGVAGYGCVMTLPQASGGICVYGATTVTNAGGDGYGVAGLGVNGVNGAQSFGGVFQAQTIAGQTSGAAHGAVVAVTNLHSGIIPGDASIEVSTIGPNVSKAIAAVEITNEGSTALPGYYKGIWFNLQNAVSASTHLATYAFITDDHYPTSNTDTELTVSNGILWDESSFTTSEYAGPSFMVGPTVANYNSRVEIVGSAGAAPGITVVGAGASPATNANLSITALGTGVVNFPNGLTSASFTSGTSAGVSCSGTPTSSFASVKGIVTHC